MGSEALPDRKDGGKELAFDEAVCAPEVAVSGAHVNDIGRFTEAVS